ncbi:MAG: HAD family hydrolase [Clostridia bacterium]|nr:HAD family hydrolase [Clostridia bacterium]
MIKYIIFDFDGTIANTNDIIIESWQAAFMKFAGHTVPVEEIERTFGETVEDTIKTKLPDENWIDVRDFFRDYQKNECKAQISLFPGIREMLEELKAKGIKMATATSRTAKSYHNFMRELDLEKYFDVEITMDDVKTHKPAPESILVALAKMGAKPEETLMVGDTRFDIGCAYNAGVDSVIIHWSHAIGELNWEPTYVAESPADIIKIVEA